MKPNWIAIGAAWGALAVLLGALGSHVLKDRVTPEDLEIWKTGVLYHALHAPALILFGLFAERRARGGGPGICFLLGSAIFSGTLYGMVCGGPRALGAVTPIGGLLLIAGWVWFGLLARRSGSPGESPRET